MSVGSERVRVDRTGGRATVTWSRPPVNALDITTLQELATALRSEAVRSAHVVVLRGADHRWSAGFAVEDHLMERVDAMFGAFRDLLEAFGGVPGPTIGQVEGPCLGGGLEILGVCDLAFAAASATFGQPEIRLGVFPPLGAAEAPSTIGPKRAADLLFLGDTMTAARAEAIGLVSRVVPDETIDEEVQRVADRLQGFRLEALVLLKRATREDPTLSKSRLERAERIYYELMELPGAEEGLHAFLEKRPPVWPSPGR